MKSVPDLIMRLKMGGFTLPPNMTNKLGLPKITTHWRGRVVLTDEINEVPSFRLSTATWTHITWSQFLRSLANEVAGNPCYRDKDGVKQSLMAESTHNGLNLYVEIKGATPETLEAQFVEGVKTLSEAAETEIEPLGVSYNPTVNTVTYITNKGRTVTWFGHPDDYGTVTANFGEEGGGSHGYLIELVGYFGLPTEALTELAPPKPRIIVGGSQDPEHEWCARPAIHDQPVGEWAGYGSTPMDARDNLIGKLAAHLETRPSADLYEVVLLPQTKLI